MTGKRCTEKWYDLSRMPTDVRWKQRLQNYEKSYLLLERLLEVEEPTEGETMGIIQAFEVCFELAWHLLGDYLKAKGYPDKSPRDILKQSFQDGLIGEGELWLRALQHRNQTTHLYNERLVQEIEASIRESYAGMLGALCRSFRKKRDEE